MANTSNVPVSEETKEKLKKLQVIYGQKAIVPMKFSQEKTLEIVVSWAFEKENKIK